MYNELIYIIDQIKHEHIKSQLTNNGVCICIELAPGSIFEDNWLAGTTITGLAGCKLMFCSKHIKAFLLFKYMGVVYKEHFLATWEVLPPTCPVQTTL